jgi:hypothetical protein
MDTEIDLADLIGRTDSDKQKIDSGAAVMRLVEWAERYAEAKLGPRFKRGDFVTPSKDCKLGGAGLPYLIIDVRVVAAMDRAVSICSCSQEDIRIIGITDHGDVASMWAESALFEEWIDPSGQ